MHDKSPIYQPLLEHFWSKVTYYFDEGSEAIFCNIFIFDDTFWFHICLRFLFIFVWNFKRSGPFLSLLPVTGFITFSTLFASKEIMMCKNCSNVCTTEHQTRLMVLILLLYSFFWGLKVSFLVVFYLLDYYNGEKA